MPAAINLSKLDDEDSMRACATVFALLSADPQGRAKFVQRKSALVSLFDLLRSTDQGTQVICGKVNMILPVSATQSEERVCKLALFMWLYSRRLNTRGLFPGVFRYEVECIFAEKF